MTDLRLTFLDLWWPQNLAIWNICMMYIKRKLSTQGYNMWQSFFSVLDHMISHDHDLTLMTFLDLSTSRIDSIIITKNIGMLHINWKLKTVVLQWKYVQTSERSNDLPQADLHWPLMTSILSVFEHMHDVYQKKAEHPRTSYALDHLTSHDHDDICI